MTRQNETFKRMHPEQFSDSIIVKKSNLTREFLDFFLNTLTSKNLEKDFEKFCRKIAEQEICPNLLPQTGPTGGGDSKVDSETYPVSEKLSENLFYGYGNNAATERWAFAFSAKKEWKQKVKSDIEKIADVNDKVNRNYTKAFFISNQYIPDKKRAETEDTLRNTYDMDVRILDRTWLLDKALKNRINIKITVESFGLSSSLLDEVQIGERDYKRKLEFEQNETKISDNDLKPVEKIVLSKRNVVLARELEYSKEEVLSLIDRSERIVKKYGMIVDIADTYYEAAWTIFWWYDDPDLFYSYYKKYEKIALSQDNVYLFKNLVTLCINLYSLSFDNKNIPFKNHAELLKEKYDTFINDYSKPNSAIEAKAAYQMIRLFLGDSPEDIATDLLKILDECDGHLDLDLYPLCRMIQEIPVFDKLNNFDELFERLVSTMSLQKQKIEAAIMLIKRGHLIKDKEPYKALCYFGRTLMDLYNESGKDYLVSTILEMGDTFERMDLLWAARNYYYYDLCLCLNRYMKSGEVHPALFASACCLKNIELKLGHTLYATGFNTLEKIFKKLYPEEIEEKVLDDNFDSLLGIQLSLTSYEIEKELGQLPSYLEKEELYFSEAVIKHEMGYYDENILEQLDGDVNRFNDLIRSLKEQPAIKQMKYSPWYGIEPTCTMKTSLLGCSIELKCYSPYNHGEIEVGATIIATLESFFSTGLYNNLISMTGNLEIELHHDCNSDSVIKGSVSENKTNTIDVIFRDFKFEEIITEQNAFSVFQTELVGMVITMMFPFEKELNKVESMIKKEAAFTRSLTFTNSVFYGMQTLGKDTFSFATTLNNFEKIEMKRPRKSEFTELNNDKDESSPSLPKEVVFCNSLRDFDFMNIKNSQIVTSTIINNSLWDKCGWKGFFYIISSKHDFPPVLSFLFSDSTCKNIFEEWIKDIGNDDCYNKIGIRIIKGIDKKHPYWYRVIVGQSDILQKDHNKYKVYGIPVRMHTMQPIYDTNLKMFEKELKVFKCFKICPSYCQNNTEKPYIYNLLISKSIDSIKIFNAWDISETDLLIESGILPTDDPIIPPGKENSLILSIIERKKQR